MIGISSVEVAVFDVSSVVNVAMIATHPQALGQLRPLSGVQWWRLHRLTVRYVVDAEYLPRLDCRTEP